MRRLLIVAAMALSLSACSLFKSLPTTNDMQKEIVRVEVQLDGIMALNYKFYMSEFIDKEQYNKNMKELNSAKSQLESVKNMLNVGQLETADERLEKISEILHSLNPS